MSLASKMERAQQVRSGILLAVAGVGLFSLKAILVKLAYRHGVDTLPLMSLRMLFSLPVYLVLGFVWWKSGVIEGDKLKGNWLALAVTGVLGYYLASFLDLTGLNYINAQLERLVLFAYPTFTVLIGGLLFKQVQGRALKDLLWLLPITWFGVALMALHDWQLSGTDVLLGTGLVAAAAFVFAFYMIFSKPLIAKVGSKAFTCIAMSAASLAILIHYLIAAPMMAIFSLPTAVYFYAIAIALFCTVLPSFMVSEAIKRIGPQRTSVTGAAGPLITAVVAVFVLGEAFTGYHLAGTVLVVGSVSWMARRGKNS